MQQIELSVVIVSYNVATHLIQCLDSVTKATAGLNAEILVVDNASTDDTLGIAPPLFPQVKFIANSQNLGFSKANNLGVAQALGNYVFIQNPDTVVPENYFASLLNHAKSLPNLGALGTRLVNANGKFHPECKRNIPNPRNTFGKLFGFLFRQSSESYDYYKTSVQETEDAPAEILVGACMLLKKEVYQKVGGFDERYFMYGEDIDLCYTLLQHGYVNYYMGSQTMLHYKGESTRKDRTFLHNFYRAMALFLQKYYLPQRWPMYVLMRIGLWFRHRLTRLMFLFSPPQKNNPVPLSEIQFWDAEATPNGNHFAFSTDKTSYQEIIETLTQHRQNARCFYIYHPERKLYIGDGVVL